jgi:hypothetical protein
MKASDTDCPKSLVGKELCLSGDDWLLHGLK